MKWMEFLPLLLFFVVYSQSNNVYWATAAMMISMPVVMCIHWLRHKNIPSSQWINLALVLVFGGATLWLQDKRFIMWKPTVLYAVLALGLWIPLCFGKNMIQRLLGSQMNLPEAVWRTLCHAWAAFFVVLGILNAYVAHHFSEDVWVKFKVFGLMALSFTFIIGQMFYLLKYLKESPSNDR